MIEAWIVVWDSDAPTKPSIRIASGSLGVPICFADEAIDHPELLEALREVANGCDCLDHAAGARTAVEKAES